jgi:Uma2 family endonuclease
MSTAAQPLLMTEEAYLLAEESADYKSEYIDGQIYVMSGAKANHNLITGNVYREMGNYLKGKPCRPYISDMKVKIGSKFFYPDVMVDCAALSGGSVYTDNPTLIVEVLSASTRRLDETTKRIAYMQIPALQEYVLIEQDFVKVEVMRRSEGWLSARYYLGDEVTFESIGLTVAVAALYDRVENSDMAAWLRRGEGEPEVQPER